MPIRSSTYLLCTSTISGLWSRRNEADHTGVPEDMDGEPAGEDGEGQDWREAEATPEAGMRATRTLRPGRWLAAVPLLAACQGPREAGRTGTGGDSGGGLGRGGPTTGPCGGMDA